MVMSTHCTPAKIKTDKLPQLIRALLTDQGCYDHPVSQLQLVETHISWVLLTGDIAYKIKKPLKLGFLDFSTLTLRKQACFDEVRLNRRLAADYYLGVVAIAGSPDEPQIFSGIHTGGRNIEYAVKMRQFPVNATLDRLDEQGELGNVQIDKLASRLAKFHLEECDISPEDSPWGEAEAITRPVAENFQLLNERYSDPVIRQRLAELQNWSDSEYKQRAQLMQMRKRKGMVRECHGDLHLGNLAWVSGQIVIFDCIEFNPALRWIDIISEVAFCFMDLLHRRLNGLAMRFLNAWLEISGDYEGIAVLRYYAVYRALVRAKVYTLRSEQSCNRNADLAEAAACLLLAEQLTQAMPTQLWITHGLSGSGKTTISQRMMQGYGMIRLRSDVERKRLAGIDAMSRSGAGIGQGLYTQQAGRHTYQHLYKLALELLMTGWPVIVDAAFLERWQRDMFRDLAKQQKVRFQILDVLADHAILRERVRRRTELSADASDADILVLQHQIQTAQPLADEELSEVNRMSGSDG